MLNRAETKSLVLSFQFVWVVGVSNPQSLVFVSFDREKESLMLYERDGQWWFSDEAEEEHGPFESRKAASEACRRYVTEFLGT